MSVSTTNTESETDSKKVNTGYETEEKKTEEDSSKTVDDYGYETEEESKDDKKSEETEEESKDDKKSEETEEESKKDHTGYETEEESKDDKKSEETEEESKDDETLKKEISEVVKNLPEGYDQEKVTNFALKNGLTKDQVNAFVEMEKASLEEFNKNQATAVEAQKQEWVADLKNDVYFGGENFESSIKKVNTLIDKHLPNLKKSLTDSPRMLPPIIMKDLLEVHKLLNPKTPLVDGEPVVPEKTQGEYDFLDDMY